MRGIEPRPRRWERRILATRPHGIDKTKLPNEQITGQVLLSLYRLWRYLALLGARELHGFIIHDRHISPNTTGLPLEKRNLCENFCAPVRGIEPRPRRWKRRILATRPHGIWTCPNLDFFVACAIYQGSIVHKTLDWPPYTRTDYYHVKFSRNLTLGENLICSRAGNRTPAAAVKTPNPSH